LSVTLKLAEYKTLANGRKVMLMVQPPPGASELPQFEAGVRVYSAAPDPVTDIPVMESAVAPGLLRVTVLVTLVLTVWVPKLRLGGLRLA
jgi:hypothetical protein